METVTSSFKGMKLLSTPSITLGIKKGVAVGVSLIINSHLYTIFCSGCVFDGGVGHAFMFNLPPCVCIF